MTHSDVLNAPATATELRDVLERHHWRSWFKVASILSYLISYPDVDQEWVRRKFHTMFTSSQLATAVWGLEEMMGWRALTPWQPLLLMKAAIAEHCERVPEDDRRLGGSDDVLRACLLLSGLLNQMEPEYTGEEFDPSVPQFTIREQSVQLPHDHTRLFPLYSNVFGALAEELDRARQGRLDAAHADCFGGLTASRMLELGTVLVMQYRTRNPQREARTVLDRRWLTAPGIRDAEREALWRLCLMQPATASEWARKYPYDDVAFFTDFGMFKGFPLLERRDGTADAVSARHVLYRVTEGVYQTLRMELHRLGRKEDHRLLQDQLGAVFEEYVRRLTHAACAKWLRDDRHYRRKSTGERREIADAVLLDDGALVLCETKAASLMRDTTVTGDLDDFDRDMQRGLLLHAAEQLHKSAADVLAGNFDSRTLDHSAVRCIYPVVVTREHIPSHGLVRERIERAIKSAGFLQQQPVHRLVWFSLNEWEMVCAAAGVAGSLARILGPCASHNDPKVSFGEIAQRQAVELKAPVSPYVEAQIRAFGEKAHKKLFA